MHLTTGSIIFFFLTFYFIFLTEQFLDSNEGYLKMESLMFFLCSVQVNGEIYNHKELRAQLKSHTFRTGSDCEVIAHLVSVLDFIDILPFACIFIMYVMMKL